MPSVERDISLPACIYVALGMPQFENQMHVMRATFYNQKHCLHFNPMSTLADISEVCISYVGLLIIL
jgi:hypothetical protein